MSDVKLSFDVRKGVSLCYTSLPSASLKYSLDHTYLGIIEVFIYPMATQDANIPTDESAMTWLKRLTMEGFKSYGPRRVELPLSRGFNAMIGPNGSGKSNIVDALLFVLGGLSTKTMRASSLTDLIFAGNKEENPSLKTRVEIVLDNADHQIPLKAEEIRISREVRRSGSSVYRLNGLVSTRKEIIDMLALGNIGFQGRSIVLQGEIIHLISQSPQQRRELVESVAGITEFDEKRVEAEKELEKARARYREIDLILGGLRESREQLIREKEEAEKVTS